MAHHLMNMTINRCFMTWDTVKLAIMHISSILTQISEKSAEKSSHYLYGVWYPPFKNHCVFTIYNMHLPDQAV